MGLAIPVQTVLELNKGGYSRQVSRLSPAKGSVYATTNNQVGSTSLLHYHEHTHISFVVRGGILDKRIGAQTEQLPGDIMFFRAGEQHQSIYQSFPSINLNVELASPYIEEIGINETQLSLSIAKEPMAKCLMLKIYKEIIANDDISPSSIESLLLLLIGRKNTERNGRPRWIETVIQLLNDNWNESLNLTDLGEEAGVHPITISKHFPRYFACTLGEYRRRLRIERSFALIKTQSLSLTEIAHECGFSDHSHFTRIFKQLTGFSPGQYRSL